MKLRILESAKEDLIEGYHFYEERAPGLGTYFLDSLFSDIDSLAIYAGIHAKVYGSHPALSKVSIRHLLRPFYRRDSGSRRPRLPTETILDSQQAEGGLTR